METLRSNIAACSIASLPLGEEAGCGDASVVRWHATGGLVAVVDGLGHGLEAARAAQTAVETLESHATEPPSRLVLRCHEKARSTRGLALSLASFDATAGTMTWIGVGNVNAVLFRAKPGQMPPQETLVLRSGVVGQRLPPLVSASLPISAGDQVIFATDGVRSDFVKSVRPADETQDIAWRILERHALGSDDALVVVVRYLGMTA
jgi:hypothetical protein